MNNKKEKKIEETKISLMDFVKSRIGDGVKQSVLENGVKIISEVLESSGKNVLRLVEHTRGSQLDLCFENDRQILDMSVNTRYITLGRKGYSSATLKFSVEDIDNVIDIIKECFNK